MARMLLDKNYSDALEHENSKFQGLSAFMELDVTVPESQLEPSSRHRWKVLQDGQYGLKIIVLDWCYDYGDPHDPPTTRYDAIFTMEQDGRETIVQVSTVTDYQFGKDIWLDHEIGLIDDPEADPAIITIRVRGNLDRPKIDYYLDLMSRSDISRKKYFEYRDRLARLVTADRPKKHSVSKIVWYCIGAAAIVAILKLIGVF